MADDKSDVPLISAYDQGSVYEEPIANDLTCYPRLSSEINLNKKGKFPNEIQYTPNLWKYYKNISEITHRILFGGKNRFRCNR